ncbi:hypothetical protein ACVWWK_001951 [Bradyrhizobium sp. LB9.1b]
MLHVLAVERVASGFDRSGNDQRVVKSKRVVAGKRKRRGMRVGGERCSIRKSETGSIAPQLRSQANPVSASCATRW